MTDQLELSSQSAAAAALLDPIRFSPPWLAKLLQDLDLSSPSRPVNRGADLTTKQRQDVDVRLQRLNSRLFPASAAEVGQVVGMVRSCLRSRASDAVASEAEVAGFMLALSDLPSFALNEAARRLICGEAGLSRTFAPTPAELRGLTVEIRAPAKWHAMQLGKLLIAEVIPVEKRASPEQIRELMSSAVLHLPEARRRGIRNPSGVDHSDKGAW